VWDASTAQVLKALASRLAAFVSHVDFIGLQGDLGAGKTTFAQGMLAALGVTGAVTSPTYQLVHPYSAGQRSIFHCDFYRLQPFEEEEIGFQEMCGSGIVLVEWPDAIRSPLPDDRLEVRIEEHGPTRRVTLNGFGAWQAKLARFRDVSSFLEQHGWGAAACVNVIGDASARTFSRLQRPRETIMLMDWPPRPDGPPIKDGRPYSDIAHLASYGTSYIALSRWLREEACLSAPEVVASDEALGLYLLEDLGDQVFGRYIAARHPLEEVYALAIDGLLAIRKAKPPREFPVTDGRRYRLPEFDREALEIELSLLLEWYFKWARGSAAPPELSASFFDAWSPFLDWLQTQEKSLALRDFHSPNLLFCEGREGVARLGVVDFQDALWAHPAYDLVSLLQDARLDVPEETEHRLYARYAEEAAKLDTAFDRDAFGKAYAILGAQRNTKILGIFARLSIRDGKHGYLAHLPRIKRYLFRNLKHPELKPLLSWYETNLNSPADKQPA
jgi:tRNA threonylcarbamoyl adenosine modification protein YjeE